jgi:hypothetical protein
VVRKRTETPVRGRTGDAAKGKTPRTGRLSDQKTSRPHVSDTTMRNRRRSRRALIVDETWKLTIGKEAYDEHLDLPPFLSCDAGAPSPPLLGWGWSPLS